MVGRWAYHTYPLLTERESLCVCVSVSLSGCVCKQPWEHVCMCVRVRHVRAWVFVCRSPWNQNRLDWPYRPQGIAVGAFCSTLIHSTCDSDCDCLYNWISQVASTHVYYTNTGRHLHRHRESPLALLESTVIGGVCVCVCVCVCVHLKVGYWDWLYAKRLVHTNRSINLSL
jgi:hypothetical protein